MALKTDDCDIRDVRFFMQAGGNGDYYCTMIEYDERGTMKSRLDYRMAMSGGQAPHEVKMAFVNLYREMEKANLNDHPVNDMIVNG